MPEAKGGVKRFTGMKEGQNCIKRFTRTIIIDKYVFPNGIVYQQPGGKGTQNTFTNYLEGNLRARVFAKNYM